MRSTLTSRLTWVFVSFAAAILLGVNAIGYYSGSSALSAAAIKELETRAGEKEAAIAAWMEEKQSDVSALSATPSILEGVRALISSPPGSPDRTMDHDRLVAEFRPRIVSGEFLDLFLLHPATGKVLLAVQPGQEDIVKADRAYFLKGKNGPYTTSVYDSPELQTPTMIASAPVVGEGGDVLAVLAGRLDPADLSAIIQRRSGLHETDDAFLVNAARLALTQPRFLRDPAVLRDGIDTLPVNLCLQEKSGTVFANDYQDVPVIASYRWLPEHQMCLIVKISQAEALAPIVDFGNEMIWIVLAVLVVATGLAFALARPIIRPILSMQKAAQRYGRGDLAVRLPETRQDELGALAHEFNHMATALAQKELELGEHARTLEQKVQERTQSLQESNSQLQRAEEIGQVGSWEWHVPEDRIVASEGLFRLLGPAARSLDPTPETFFKCIHPQDVERMQRTVEEALQKGGPFDAECRVVQPDGQVRTLYARGESVLDEQGTPLRLTGVAIDITERKQTEMQLTDALEFTEHVLTSAPVGIFTYRLSGECLSVNAAAAQMVGGSIEQLQAQNFHHIESWKRSGLYEMARQTIGTGTPASGDVHVTTSFGREAWYTAQFALFRSGGEDHLLMMFSDITERKWSEAALETSEKRFRTWIENSSDIVTVLDSNGFIQYESPSVKRLMDYDPEELLGKRAFDFIHPDDQDRIITAFIENVQTPDSSVSAEFRFRHRDGSWRFLEAISRAYVDEHGEVVGLIHSRDITERKQAEMTVASAQRGFQALIENAPDGIAVLGLDGKLRQVTPSTQQILGYTLNEAEGQEPAKLTHPDDLPALLTVLNDLIQNPCKVSQMVYRFQHKDGSWRWLESTISNLIAEPGVEAIVFNYRDVTDRKRAEKALQEKERLLLEAQRIGRIGSWSYDVFSDAMKFSDEMYNLLDVLPEEFQHNRKEFLALVYPSDRPLAAKWLKDIREGTQAKDLDFRIIHKNGELRYLHCTGAVEFDASARPARFIGTAQDVSERRAAEMQIDQQIKRLTALSEIDRAIISSFDQRYTLGVILSQMLLQLQVDAAGVLIMDEDEESLNYVAGQGFRTKMRETAQLHLGESHAGRAAQERRMIRIPDLRETTSDQDFSRFVVAEDFVSYIAVPLVVKGKVKGVLEVFQRTLLQPYQDWLEFFNTLAGQTAIALESTSLFANLQDSNRELTQAYEATIEGWSRAMDLRDRETEGHTQRVTKLTLELARRMGIDESRLIHIRRGALLHDIGKLGVPDHILFKPGELTVEERRMIERHVDFAFEMLAPIPYLKPALNIPYFHHEKWDGTGYPLGIKGEQIPFEARIFALVDVWDALLSDRPYRQAWTPEQAREYIRAQAGTHFDPRVVECFLEMIRENE